TARATPARGRPVPQPGGWNPPAAGRLVGGVFAALLLGGGFGTAFGAGRVEFLLIIIPALLSFNALGATLAIRRGVARAGLQHPMLFTIAAAAWLGAASLTDPHHLPYLAASVAAVLCTLLIAVLARPRPAAAPTGPGRHR
ncbi:hypothetical protein, partial [Kitasatospora sp. LaBMicrA B282]|uniref:hypothetical protein n=1 Tax=Kitasatospora sp. LaBMicrA B282 TaxID=3420949 RepID=UPI003D106661